MAEITLNRDEVIKNSGKIIPPSLGATEISAARQKKLNEYFIQIIIKTDVRLTDEMS